MIFQIKFRQFIYVDKNNPTLGFALKQKRIHSRLLVCRSIVFHWLLWRGHGGPRQILQESLPQHQHSVIRMCVQKDSQFRIRLWIVFMHIYALMTHDISIIWTSCLFSTISFSPLFFHCATLKYISFHDQKMKIGAYKGHLLCATLAALFTRAALLKQVPQASKRVIQPGCCDLNSCVRNRPWYLCRGLLVGSFFNNKKADVSACKYL